MPMRPDQITTWRFSSNVGLALAFLVEVLLTDKWDHIFPEGLPLLPRENPGFCLGRMKSFAGSQVEGDVKLVEFADESIGSRFVVGLRSERMNTFIRGWYPNSIQGTMRILRKETVAKLGKDVITIPPTKVVYVPNTNERAGGQMKRKLITD